MKKAMALYEMKVEITNSSDPKAKNALYSKGPIRHFNNGIEVQGGPVTFEDDVVFQGNNSIFRGQAYFGGKTRFSGGVTTFKDKTYFHKDVMMDGGGIFDSAVGINKNIASDNAPVNFKNTIWMNGDFGIKDDVIDKQNPPNNARDFKLVGTDNTKLYYTDNFSWKCDECVSDEPDKIGNKTCTVHNKTCSQHFNFKWNDNDVPNNVQNSNPDDWQHGNPIENCGTEKNSKGEDVEIEDCIAKDSLKMGTLSERRECGFHLGDPMATNSKDKGIYSVTPKEPKNAQIYLSDIENWYNEAKNADPSRLYDGHVVVKLNKNNIEGNSPSFHINGSATQLFKDKVIFIVEGDTQLDGDYFNTTPQSSTMIYVKDNARIYPFKINGTFHGLIYIDENNKWDDDCDYDDEATNKTCNTENNANQIGAGGNDKIVGAIHNLSKRNLLMNGKDSENAGPPVVEFGKEALKNFSKLSNCGEEGEYTAEYIVGSGNRVRLRPLGYYFY
jgi:hypothetical protein